MILRIIILLCLPLFTIAQTATSPESLDAQALWQFDTGG